MTNTRALKLISLNIELDRHLDAVLPFLKREQADIVCLQEVRERSFQRLKDDLHLSGLFVPTCVPDIERVVDAESLGEGRLVVNDELLKLGPEGVALLTALPVRSSRSDCYVGDPTQVPRWSAGQNRMLLSATVEKDGAKYTIGTMHFTWTPDGKPSSEQRHDVKKLLETLARFPDIVLCGDFNAPRGGEIWAELAKHYKDNIPAAYRSSLDPHLHRVNNLERMVDGIFSTPEYRVFDVRLVEGVSDHKAVVGFVERVK